MGISPNASLLRNILYNDDMFEMYAYMFREDMEDEHENFKYIAMYTNPEAFKELEINNITKEQIIKQSVNSMEYKDGIEATQKLTEKYDLKNEVDEEGMEIREI